MGDHSESISEQDFVNAMQHASAAWGKQFPQGADTDFQACFDKSIQELQDAILEHEPTILLSSCAFDNLFASSLSALVPDVFRPKRLEQHHVEFLQAVVISKNREVFWPDAPKMTAVDRVESALVEATQAYAIQRLKAAHDKHGELGQIIGSTQLHTLAVRNFAYPQQFLGLIKEMYAPLESRISSALGFKPEILARMLFDAVKRIENRITDEVNSSLLPVLRSRSFDEIAKIAKVQPELEQAGRVLTLARQQKWSLSQLKYTYLEWWKLRLPDLMTLSSTDLHDCYSGSIDMSVLNRILDSWSMEFGAILPSNLEHIMLANPVWDRPFVKLKNNQFLLPVANLLIGFCPRLIWNAVAEDANLAAELHDRKADFLESSVESLFCSNFPTADVFVNMEWRDTIAQGENDVVVLLPPYALIVEAKSGAMDIKAKRGAPTSLKESLKKLVEDPANQSAGLIQWIKRNPGKHNVKTKYGNKTIDCSAITEFVQLSVTLEHFCPQSSNWQSLADVGLVAATSTPVPSVRLTDLQCVLEILSTQSEKLHYWIKRQQVEAVAMPNDELGWLKLYLDNRLMFKPTEAFMKLPLLPAYAQLFNGYFLREDTLIDVPKPTSAIPQEVAEAINIAESERIEEFINVGCMLLDLWNEQQSLLSRLIQGVRAGKGSENFGSAQFDCIELSSEGENLAFCAVVDCLPRDSTELAKQIFRTKHHLDCVVIFGCAGPEQPKSVSFVRLLRRNAM